MTTTHLHTSWKTMACGASCKRRCTKHASLISTTSNIASELSGPSWITPSLLQLCISGDDVFQLVWRWVVVISSTAFNSDIQTVVGWYSGVIFLWLSIMTLCILIHDDRLIHKVKQWHWLGVVDFCCVNLVLYYLNDIPYTRITTIHLYLSKLYLKQTGVS